MLAVYRFIGAMFIADVASVPNVCGPNWREFCVCVCVCVCVPAQNGSQILSPYMYAGYSSQFQYVIRVKATL